MTTKTKKEQISTIHSLRMVGYKVRVYHARQYIENSIHKSVFMSKRNMFDSNESEYFTLSDKGGYSRIDLTTPDNKHYSAKFNFSPHRQFNRKLGIRVCLGKIFKQIERDC